MQLRWFRSLDVATPGINNGLKPFWHGFHKFLGHVYRDLVPLIFYNLPLLLLRGRKVSANLHGRANIMNGVGNFQHKFSTHIKQCYHLY